MDSMKNRLCVADHRLSPARNGNPARILLQSLVLPWLSSLSSDLKQGIRMQELQ